MTTIIIDEQPYLVNQDKNLLEISLSLGLDLPYFCWHPALGSVGSCRQCAVVNFADDQDKNGRVVMACMTPVKEGMRFSIKHQSCTDFRKQVIEWLMINHPHDCPVCDEGGECHLQDMTVMTGHNYRRSRFLKRTFNNQNLGPLINHEMNRCITCYRCVRFYRDVAGGKDLAAFASSGRVYFGRFSDGTLENSFSGNLAEVCPTGVFTDKVFHNRYVRKWDLATAPSICQLCSLGCNISPQERGGVLRRVQNRIHPDINGYFICDRGRFGHDFINDHRLLSPLKNQEPISLNEAHALIKETLAQSNTVVGIGSARASLEANWILKQWVLPKNFYEGSSDQESVSSQEVLRLLSSSAIPIASLEDVRQTDYALIIAEDIAGRAPMLELAIRQAALLYRQDKAKTDIGVSPWNDAPVRDYARESLPIFSMNVFDQPIDGLDNQSITLSPADLLNLCIGLECALLKHDLPQNLDEKSRSWIEQATRALLKAKRPVIIAGTSLAEPKLLELAAKIASQLAQNSDAKLCFVLPKANSLGLALLAPKPFSKLASFKSIDAAIVLEADLEFELGSKPFREFIGRVKNLIVIDSLMTKTVLKANIALPCLSFAESTGSLLNNEGRLQRYYSVFKNKDNVEASFRTMISLMDQNAQERWPIIDEINRSMEFDVPFLSHAFDTFVKADFTILGRGIARQTSEFSGRTAMNANVSVHEKKPLEDPDSPLVFSMEGARNKIPLPLISTSWQPGWNSIQALFRTESMRFFPKDNHDGVRLFQYQKDQPFLFESVEVSSKVTAPLTWPSFYVLPRYHIFASFEQASFCHAFSSLMPSNTAFLSDDYQDQFHLASSEIILSTPHGDFPIKIEFKKMAREILLLPYGLFDAAVFYQPGKLMIGEHR